MRWARHWRSWLRTAFGRSSMERDLDRELRFHVEQQTAEHVASGMSVDEARRVSGREFGSRAFTADACRDARGSGVVDHLARDTRHAIRRLARDWRFTSGAVLILALGIGANTVVFSVVNAALFRGLPFRDTHELVNVYQNSRREGEASAASYPVYQDIAAYGDVFDGVAGFSMPLPIPVKVGDQVRPALVEFATSSYADVLGLQPALGRWFNPDEEQPGGSTVAVLGHEAWVSRFDASRDVIGQAIQIDAVPVTVIGVAPKGYNGSVSAGLVTDFWMSISVLPLVGMAGPTPLARDLLEPFFLVKARLRDGVSVPQARAAMTVLGERLAREYPNEDPGRGFTVLASDDVRVHPQVDSVLVAGSSLLVIVVGLVLAIACSNLATLLLVRGSSRAREVAVRLALGASRGQLVRLLVAESVVLAVAGGCAGYLLAEWAIRLVALMDLPLVLDLTLDYRVLGFTLLLSIATGVAFGLAPALGATRVDLVPELRNEGSAVAARGRWFTLKNGLLVGQIAASSVLLVVAGLFLRALTRAERIDPGFSVDRLAFIETNASYAGYDSERAPALYEELRSRIARLPGVESAVLANGAPVGGFLGVRAVAVEGYQPGPEEVVQAQWAWAGPGYFETTGIPTLYGRTFTDFDRAGTRVVAVVNERFSIRYFGTPDAVGRRFRMADAPGARVEARSGPELEVVGVVRDTRTSLLDEPGPLFYRSYLQGPAQTPTVIVRTSMNPSTVLQPMQRVLRELDPGLPVMAAATLDQHVKDSLGMPRAASRMLTALGGLGLALACVGLYAVVAFAVSKRTLEIGIRMALGARRSQVVWTLTRDVATLLATGLGLGLALSWLAIQALGALFVDLSEAPNIDIGRPVADAATLAVVMTIMGVVGLAATLLPARRATRAEPLSALRHL